MTNPFEAIHSQLDRLEHLMVQLLNREPSQSTGGPEEPIGVDEVARLLKISKGAVYQSKDIPRHKRKGKLLFFESEILAYIKNTPESALAVRRPQRNTPGFAGQKVPL